MSDDLHTHSLYELSEMVLQGELSPVEVTEYFLRRIEAMDGQLNAFRMPTPDRAMDAARAAELLLVRGQRLSALHGLPYVAKDLFDVAGLPTTAGTRVLDENVAERDATVIQRLSQAGMVMLGKTNTVQFAYGGVGINHDHGTPHNPWHREAHAPGGSSSGSGVAVAAGMAPMGLGTDTGGSVRIPAALCGTTGLKTTVGRVSRAGVYPLSWSLDSVGPLTRTVKDAGLVYELLAGRDAADPSTIVRPPQRVSRMLDGDIRGLRVAIAESVFWDDADPEVAAAVRETTNAFNTLGARVSSIEFDGAARALALNPGGLIIAAEAYTLNRVMVDQHFDELDPVVGQRIVKGRDVSAHEYLGNLREWESLRDSALDELRDIDVLLCPATMYPALPVAEVDADAQTYSHANLGYLRNTSIGNILNLCGLSVPCGFTAKGLPIGLMLYAKPYDESTLLRVGHAFQQVTDWHTRRPPLDWL